MQNAVRSTDARREVVRKNLEGGSNVLKILPVPRESRASSTRGFGSFEMVLTSLRHL